MAAASAKKVQKKVTGKPVTAVPGFVLVKSVKPSWASAKVAKVARSGPSPGSPSSLCALLPRVASAFRHPGIDKTVVFKGRSGKVYAYSIDPSDPSRVIRMSSDGTRAVGKLVGEKFVVAKPA